MHENYE